MTKIAASEVNKLRQQTGAGMMDCKKALVETHGDFDKAIDVLRKKGQKVAAKRADRQATEGAVLALVSNDSKIGAILSLNCETDFVAKNDSFLELAQSFLNIAIQYNVQNLNDLLELNYNDSISIKDKLVEQTGVIGEKLELTNYHIINADCVHSYIHPGNKLASLVGFNISLEILDDVGKNIAMQVAAMNPLGLDESDVSQEIIDKEMEIGKDLARQEGKPENMLEKIATGRLRKFFKENTLINQSYIKDTKKTVMQYLSDSHADLSVIKFKRVQLG